MKNISVTLLKFESWSKSHWTTTNGITFPETCALKALLAEMHVDECKTKLQLTCNDVKLV